jgi:drug/metabolite transporter (DMT)-like permease
MVVGGLGVIVFLVVSVLWGVPYLLIKVALTDLPPTVMVFGRVLVAALVLLAIAARRGTLGQLRGRFPAVAAIAVTHVIAPFLLITFGEQHISSSLNGLLIAIEPVLFALLLIRAERLTPLRVTGLAAGLIGVAVLVGLDVSGDRLGLLGAGLVLLAALSYSVTTVLVQRWAAGIAPEALAAGTTSVSAVVLAPVAAFALPLDPVGPGPLTALVALGVLCTAVAMLAFYELVALAGPGRAGLIAYVNPLVAVVLGVPLLDEPFGLGTVAGFVLIAAGCWLSTRPIPAAAAAPAAPERQVPVGG